MRCSLTLLLTLAAAGSASAFTPLGTSGADPNNYGSFTGSTLDSVTLDGVTYTTGALVQIELTAFRGQTASVLLQNDGGPTNPTAQQRRDFLETDWRGSTGIINPSTTNDSVAANFNSPVPNITGPDMFLYEINTSGADSFEIRINGVQLTVDGSDYRDSGADTSDDLVLSLSGTPTDLNDLLTSSAAETSSNINQNIMGVAIDFSDFGIAPGATVSSFSYNSATSSTFDPVIIAAVPEPRIYALLTGMAALAWIVVRRRKRD